jgi:hypothetical protein
MCARCVRAHEEDQVKERANPAGKSTFLRCGPACDVTLQLPSAAAVGSSAENTEGEDVSLEQVS